MSKPVSSELARLHTQQSWHRFQARERRRQRAFRIAGAVLILTVVFALLRYL